MSANVVAVLLTAGVLFSIVWLYQDPQLGSVAALTGAIALLITHIVAEERKAARDVKHFSPYNRLFPYALIYRRHLKHRHLFADVRGISQHMAYNLKLEDIFVEPKLSTVAPEAVRKGLVLEALAEQTAGEDIWTHITSPILRDDYDFVVLGPPGCGKTALLKHITLVLTSPRRLWREPRLARRIPALLYLRNHAGNILEREQYELEDAIEFSISKWGPPPPKNWVSKKLAAGRFLVMFDGLDEVRTSRREEVVAWVQEQLNSYPGTTFILTSRPHGYEHNPLTGVQPLGVNDFVPQQVDEFVLKWYIATERLATQKDSRAVRLLADDRANDLLTRIADNKPMKALSSNPLLLSIIVTVHRPNRGLPENRVELYERICQLFLTELHASRNVKHEIEFNLEQQLRVLRQLAFYMMEKSVRELPAEEACSTIAPTLRGITLDVEPADFLAIIERRSGLLVEPERGEYGFAHRTFQEYLAAEHIREQRLDDYLLTRVVDDAWRETILLYVARSDATRIIEQCLDERYRNTDALVLAILCLEQAGTIEPAVRARLNSLLNDELEESDSETRRAAAEALLRIKLKNFVRLDRKVEADPDLLANTQFQLFLEAQNEREDYEPDHWRGNPVAKRQGVMPIAGVRSSTAQELCEWLTERFGDGEWRYRLFTDEEFDRASTAKSSKYWTIASESVGCWVTDEDGPLVRFEGKTPEPIGGAVLGMQARNDIRLLDGKGLLPESSSKRDSSALRSTYTKYLELLEEEIDVSPIWIDLHYSQNDLEGFKRIVYLALQQKDLLSIIELSKLLAIGYRGSLFSGDDKLWQLQSELRNTLRALQGVSGKSRSPKESVDYGGGEMRVAQLDRQIQELQRMRETWDKLERQVNSWLSRLESLSLHQMQNPVLPRVTSKFVASCQGDIVEACGNQRGVGSAEQTLRSGRKWLVLLLDDFATLMQTQAERITELSKKTEGIDPLEVAEFRLEQLYRLKEDALKGNQESSQESSPTKELERAIIRAYLLAAGMQCASFMTDGHPSELEETALETERERVKEMERMCWWRFAEWTILEKRIKGELTAVEGIRLARERVIAPIA